MKKCFALLLALMILLSCSMPAFAADGSVVYNGNAKSFIFAPCSEYSPTDLFPNFKDVMPGDSISQTITIRNDASKKVNVAVYMRALGAHPDSTAFLSQLNLTVTKGTDTELFDAPADQTAQLTDWVYLGTLRSGGQCDLLVTLDVPVELDNTNKNLIGYLDWEFAVRESPVPQTGDSSNALLWMTLLGGSLMMLMFLLFGIRKKNEQE